MPLSLVNPLTIGLPIYHCRRLIDLDDFTRRHCCHAILDGDTQTARLYRPHPNPILPDIHIGLVKITA